MRLDTLRNSQRPALFALALFVWISGTAWADILAEAGYIQYGANVSGERLLLYADGRVEITSSSREGFLQGGLRAAPAGSLRFQFRTHSPKTSWHYPRPRSKTWSLFTPRRSTMPAGAPSIG